MGAFTRYLFYAILLVAEPPFFDDLVTLRK
jgi:hypothetical protein